MEPETLFRAMADGTRWRTLAVLRRHELGVSELVEVLHQPQSTISRHLRVLREAGLIRDRRDGNAVLYSLPTTSQNGQEDALRLRLLEWIAEQPLPASVSSRLEALIRRGRDRSRRFFDRTGKRWDALREESFGPCFHWEAFLALLPSAWTVADIGTGTGYLLPGLARHFDRVIAVEPVERMLQVARNRVDYHGLANVGLCHGDLGQLPISDAGVDLVTAALVLHHIPAVREALTELHRILHAGGCVLIVEQMAHNSAAFRDRMQDHWWGFDPDEFCGWLTEAGFAGVRSQTLATVDRATDAPDLFVVTGHKADRSANSLLKNRGLPL